MYFAICDDNIADRKQSERLLKRQADRIFKEKEERIYLHSYGNVDAFMSKPQMYQALFIDMTSSDHDGIDIAKLLLDMGIAKPIILCCSSIDYRERAKEEGLEAENLYFLDKPIKVAEITAMVDTIMEKREVPAAKLELRDHDGTVYAGGDDIVCVKGKGQEINIYLADGRKLNLLSTVYDFFYECGAFPQICPVSDNALINVNHIQKKSLLSVKMNNGESFLISLYYRDSINDAIEKCCREGADS
ncbi:MAG: hypothetical protein J5802_06015 [Butyrivibrio sp.]|nr:hypothetical protein [Butyrivibrio sp.]